jgi:hypothetical protein
MTKYVKNEAELLNDLKNQITLIKNSANLFDNGCEIEAINLATRIRVIVHNTKNATSLLSQLNKSNILFYDVANEYLPENLLTQSPLLIMKMGDDKVEFIPPLDNFPDRRVYKKRSFNNWWSRVYIFKDKNGTLFTRENIVREVTDKDGGAHIDPALNTTYADISRFNSLAFKYINKDGEESQLPSPIPAAIRQIAHEVLKTLQDEFPSLF